MIDDIDYFYGQGFYFGYTGTLEYQSIMCINAKWIVPIGTMVEAF